MTVVAFVDETFRDPHTDPCYYQLTAALVDPSDLAVCRSALLKIAPARDFHASDLAQSGATKQSKTCSPRSATPSAGTS